MQSALLSADSGSSVKTMFAPDAAAHLRKGGFGASAGGVATFSVKPNFAAAWIHEVQTLLQSPVHATVRPRIDPFFSSNVITSAMIWHGCDSLVRPLTTGTLACSANSSSILWSRVRIMIAST